MAGELQQMKQNIQLDLFSNQQQEEQEKSEFQKLDVAKQNEELNKTITGKSYLKRENAFKDKEWFLKQETPTDAQIKTEVEKDYRDLYGRNIGWNERIKAKREYKKKHKAMKKLREMTREEAYKSVKKEEMVKPIVDAAGIQVRDEFTLLGLFEMNEKAEMEKYMKARVLSVITRPDVLEKMSDEELKVNEENKKIKREVSEDTIRRFEELDTKDFEFKSLEDLVERAPILHKKAHLGFVMRQYVKNEFENNGGELGEERKQRLWARIDAFESMTALTDMALSVYSSPYYASLRSSSIDALTPERLDEIRYGDDVSDSMAGFCMKLITLKQYMKTGEAGDHHACIKPGESFETLVERALERRDIMGYAQDDGSLTIEQLEKKATPLQNYKTIVSLKKMPTCPDNFTEESYTLYKKARAQNPQIRNPELVKLLNLKGVQYKQQTMEISRVGGALLRHVEYDENWKPVSEEDKLNHEWNLKYAKNLNKLALGDDSVQNEMNEMVREEMQKVYPANFDFPEPAIFNDLIETLKNNIKAQKENRTADIKPVDCPWIEDILKGDMKAISDLIQRNLCYDNAVKIFPEAGAEFAKEVPWMDTYVLGVGALSNLISGYCSFKYGFSTDTYNNAKPDEIGAKQFETPELLEFFVSQYKEGYDALKNAKQA